MKNKAFTLIELLVVVLIIAVLTAIIYPQYKKAIEKSRVAQVIPTLKALASAQEIYFLGHGEYANSFNDLDIDLASFTKDTMFNNYTDCTRDTRANNDWSFQIQNCDEFDIHRVVVGRVSGPYQGSAWAMELNNDKRFLCVMQETQGVKYDWAKNHINYCNWLGFKRNVMTAVWNAYIK